jgi:hypothetical protein
MGHDDRTPLQRFSLCEPAAPPLEPLDWDDGPTAAQLDRQLAARAHALHAAVAEAGPGATTAEHRGQVLARAAEFEAWLTRRGER